MSLIQFNHGNWYLNEEKNTHLTGFIRTSAIGEMKQKFLLFIYLVVNIYSVPIKSVHTPLLTEGYCTQLRKHG